MQLRFLLASSVLLASAMALPSLAAGPQLDNTGQYQYVVPQGWRVIVPPRGAHDVLVLPAADGKNRNIIVTNQPGTTDLKELARRYERDLAVALKNFKLVSNEIVQLRDKRPAMRLINTNTMPGIAVRQVDYVVEAGKNRYFVSCTVLEEDGEKYDAVFEEFVTSIARPVK